MKTCRRAWLEHSPIFTPARATFTNAGWEAQTTRRFGNTLKATATRLFQRTRIFRNAVCCVVLRPKSSGFAWRTVPARKLRDSSGVLWQQPRDLSKKTRNPASSLDRVPATNRRQPPARLASYYRARNCDEGPRAELPRSGSNPGRKMKIAYASGHAQGVATWGFAAGLRERRSSCN